jgi:GT2 family glycosyltransferase
MEAKIGLVTVLYNSDGVLDGFLKSVSEQDYKNYILYIVDNSVNDKSTKLLFDLLEKYDLNNKTIYLPSDKNYGVAKGNNIGILKSLEDYCDIIALVNNDIEFYDKNLFYSIVKRMNNLQTFITTVKIYFHNENLIWFVNGVFKPFKSGVLHIDEGKIDNGQFDNQIVLEYAPTCFMFFKKEVFQKVGLIDENYFVYMDDADYIYRCNQHKFHIERINDQIIYHKVGKSTGGNLSDFSFYYVFRNRIYFALKHFSFLLIIMSLSYLITGFLIKAIKQKKIKLYKKAILDAIALSKIKYTR